MPLSSVELKFKILELLHADAYGETYRIMIGKKRSGMQDASDLGIKNSKGI